jgi:hypothetical protein
MTARLPRRHFLGQVSSLPLLDVAYRLIHNDTFPSWWLSPSNMAPRAPRSVGTAGRPRPASARRDRQSSSGANR